MFQHGQFIGGRKGHGTARATLADDDRDQRHLDLQAFLSAPRDGFRLPALFGAFARIGAGRVDQRYDWQAKPIRHLHQADRFAIALGSRHAEIPLDPGLGVMALLMADHHDRCVVEPRQPAHHRMIISEIPITCQRGVFGEKRADIVAAMGPVRVARHLAFTPGRQVAIKLHQHIGGLFVERFGLFLDIHFLVLAC